MERVEHRTAKTPDRKRGRLPAQIRGVRSQRADRATPRRPTLRPLLRRRAERLGHVDVRRRRVRRDSSDQFGGRRTHAASLSQRLLGSDRSAASRRSRRRRLHSRRRSIGGFEAAFGAALRRDAARLSRGPALPGRFRHRHGPRRTRHLLSARIQLCPSVRTARLPERLCENRLHARKHAYRKEEFEARYPFYRSTVVEREALFGPAARAAPRPACPSTSRASAPERRRGRVSRAC